MYRIYEKDEAILRVQNYLRIAGNPTIFVAPTGVFDDNTRLSVIDFQEKNDIKPTGVVDKATFDLLFLEYSRINEVQNTKEETRAFISFPILPGTRSRGMVHINRTLAELLNYYGHTHNLRSGSNFYTSETAEAVRIMREIYLLRQLDLIDTELYGRMILDACAIQDMRNNQASVD